MHLIAGLRTGSNSLQPVLVDNLGRIVISGSVGSSGGGFSDTLLTDDSQTYFLGRDDLSIASTGGAVSLQAAPVVAIGAAHAESAVVGANTTRVILCATVDCWVAIGDNPTAAPNASGNVFLPAGVPSYPIIVSGGVTKVSVIQASSSGYLSIQECA